jgi:hypothetical protein
MKVVQQARQHQLLQPRLPGSQQPSPLLTPKRGRGVGAAATARVRRGGRARSLEQGNSKDSGGATSSRSGGGGSADESEGDESPIMRQLLAAAASPSVATGGTPPTRGGSSSDGGGGDDGGGGGGANGGDEAGSREAPAPSRAPAARRHRPKATPLKKGAYAHLLSPGAPDPRLCLWEPPASPYGLIEEELYHNPWKLLLACMLLNKTSGKQARSQGVTLGGGGVRWPRNCRRRCPPI